MSFTQIPLKEAGYEFTVANWNAWVRDNINEGVMRPLAHNTLGTATTISWTSISSSYDHLMLFFSAYSDYTGTTSDEIYARFNNDTGSNYESQYLGSQSTTGMAAANSASQSALVNAGWTSGDVVAQGVTSYAPHWVMIPNYAGTTHHKAWLLGGQHHMRNSLDDPTPIHWWLSSTNIWKSTSAINRIDIYPNNGTNFLAGSIFTLYGIAAGTEL